MPLLGHKIGFSNRQNQSSNLRLISEDLSGILSGPNCWGSLGICNSGDIVHKRCSEVQTTLCVQPLAFFNRHTSDRETDRFTRSRSVDPPASTSIFNGICAASSSP